MNVLKRGVPLNGWLKLVTFWKYQPLSVNLMLQSTVYRLKLQYWHCCASGSLGQVLQLWPDVYCAGLHHMPSRHHGQGGEKHQERPLWLLWGESERDTGLCTHGKWETIQVRYYTCVCMLCPHLTRGFSPPPPPPRGGLSLAQSCVTHSRPPTYKMDPKWRIAPCNICAPKWRPTCKT